MGSLDEGKRVVDGQNLTTDSRRIQNQEEVVPEEQQPPRHRRVDELDEVEEVARHFHKGPTTHHPSSLIGPQHHELHAERLLDIRTGIRISPSEGNA